MCARLAQYREATSDIAETLEFFRTVHGDELSGYDGDSVRYIVETLRSSRPHLYPPASAATAVFSYNSSASSSTHNASLLSVPVVADVRQLGDGPPTAAAASTERRRRAGSLINRIGGRSHGEAWASVSRRRHQAPEAAYLSRERKQLSSSRRSAPARRNNVIGGGGDYVDETIVVLRNGEYYDNTTPRPDDEVEKARADDDGLVEDRHGPPLVHVGAESRDDGTTVAGDRGCDVVMVLHSSTLTRNPATTAPRSPATAALTSSTRR